jgi:hypothetical protein
MEIPPQTRALVLTLTSATALLGQAAAREIIRRAVAADELNWKVARNFGFRNGLTRAVWIPRDG